MSVDLTQEQQQALDQEKPLRVIDPRTKQAYVLIGVEEYERVKRMLEEAEDQDVQKAWQEMATKTRRRIAQENPY